MAVRVPLPRFDKARHLPSLRVNLRGDEVEVSWEGAEAGGCRRAWSAGRVDGSQLEARIKKARQEDGVDDTTRWVCVVSVAKAKDDPPEESAHALAAAGEAARREAHERDNVGDRAAARAALERAADACRRCLRTLGLLPARESASHMSDEDRRAARTAAMGLVRSLEHIGGEDAQAELRVVCPPLVTGGFLPFDDPLQRPAVLIRGLVPTQPWWDTAEVPMAAHLAGLDWRVLRDEVLTALAAARANVQPSAPSRHASDEGWRHTAAMAAPPADTVGALSEGWRRIVSSGAWTELPLFAGHAVVEQNCRLVPRTAHGIGTAPDATEVALCGAGECVISVLRPGTCLRPHCGPSNNRLTCHLALQVPPERTRDDGTPACAIRVGDAPPRAWREGEVLVFDDSFEHEVWYDADPDAPDGGPDRIIALCHCWHPQLSGDDGFRFKTAEAVRMQGDGDGAPPPAR